MKSERMIFGVSSSFSRRRKFDTCQTTSQSIITIIINIFLLEIAHLGLYIQSHLTVCISYVNLKNIKNKNLLLSIRRIF